MSASTPALQEWSARCYTLNLMTIVCYSKPKGLNMDGNLGSKDCRAAFVTQVLLTLGLAARTALVRRAALTPTITSLVKPDNLSMGPTAKATKMPAIADLQHNCTGVVSVTQVGSSTSLAEGTELVSCVKISGRTPEAALDLSKIIERLTESPRLATRGFQLTCEIYNGTLLRSKGLGVTLGRQASRPEHETGSGVDSTKLPYNID